RPAARRGDEMQHDTSPHRVALSGKAMNVQCAGQTLAYSRRLFIQYYPRFTRFEAKHFLLEAVRFNDGSLPLCVLDNTTLPVVAGSGPDAMIAPEMVAFARSLVLCVSSRARRSKRSNRETLLVRRAELPGWPLIRRLRRFESPGVRLVPRGRQP